MSARNGKNGASSGRDRDVVATGLATGATVAYRLLGKSSIAAKVGKAASAISVVVSLTRAALRVRRFW